MSIKRNFFYCAFIKLYRSILYGKNRRKFFFELNEGDTIWEFTVEGNIQYFIVNKVITLYRFLTPIYVKIYLTDIFNKEYYLTMSYDESYKTSFYHFSTNYEDSYKNFIKNLSYSFQTKNLSYRKRTKHSYWIDIRRRSSR